MIAHLTQKQNFKSHAMYYTVRGLIPKADNSKQKVFYGQRRPSDVNSRVTQFLS